MVIFELQVLVACYRCRKVVNESIQVSDWSSHKWERDYMIDTVRTAGWVVPWNARMGVTGKVLCPDCAARLGNPPEHVNCKCSLVEAGEVVFGETAAAVKWNGDWCERCGGRGEVRNEGMVWVQCPECKGRKVAAGEDDLPVVYEDQVGGNGGQQTGASDLGRSGAAGAEDNGWPLPVEWPHG